MKVAYLKNGEQVQLNETLSNGDFVIQRILVYEDFEGFVTEEPCGIKEVVKKVFLKPPIDKKHNDFINLIEKIEVKNKELMQVEKELYAAKCDIRKNKNYKTNLEKHIINNSELRKAKRITVFCKHKAYTLATEKEIKSLRLTYTISTWDSKLENWICRLDYDGRGFSNETINQKYGILINATDDEILRIHREIIAESKDISDYDLKYISDESLTEELLKRKQENKSKLDASCIKKLKSEIEAKKELIIKYQKGEINTK